MKKILILITLLGTIFAQTSLVGTAWENVRKNEFTGNISHVQIIHFITKSDFILTEINNKRLLELPGTYQIKGKYIVVHYYDGSVNYYDRSKANTIVKLLYGRLKYKPIKVINHNYFKNYEHRKNKHGNREIFKVNKK
jgi:hypothetical protein